MPLMSFAWRQMHANFLRRYKWAFGKGYELSPVPVVAPPDFDSFTDTCGRILQVCSFPALFCALILIIVYTGQDVLSPGLFQPRPFNCHGAHRVPLCGWLRRAMDG
jgi:hypothetical protein